MGKILFAKSDPTQKESRQPPEAWDILIADDDPSVHEMTRIVLKGFTYNQKQLRFTSTYSGKETLESIRQTPGKYALVLLDVIMESDDAGLQVAKKIREELHDDEIRIILRTGQPGTIPEQEIVEKYDINDYKEKTELTAVKLYTLMRTSLKTYEGVKLAKEYAHHLENRVAEEVAKNREQEKLMIVQSKQAAVGEALSMIAHQWRQPLAVITGAANNLLTEIMFGNELTPEKLEPRLNVITKETGHLSQTIDLFQDYFSTNSSGKPFPLKAYVEELCHLFESFLAKQDITLEKELAADINVSFSKSQLSQVFVNIVKNANDVFKARQNERSGTDKTLKIQSHLEDAWIYIDFIDNAGGIDPNIIDRIFEPYFTTKEKLNRAGLGLYLCKTVIEEQMKGKLSVKNLPDGCCFTVMLPR